MSFERTLEELHEQTPFIRLMLYQPSSNISTVLNLNRNDQKEYKTILVHITSLCLSLRSDVQQQMEAAERRS